MRGLVLLSSLALALLGAPLSRSPSAGPWHALDGSPAGSLRSSPSPGFFAPGIVESPASQLQLSRPGSEGPGFVPWDGAGGTGPRRLASLAAVGRWRLGAARDVPDGYLADRPGLSTCCPQGPPGAV